MNYRCIRLSSDRRVPVESGRNEPGKDIGAELEAGDRPREGGRAEGSSARSEAQFVGQSDRAPGTRQAGSGRSIPSEFTNTLKPVGTHDANHHANVSQSLWSVEAPSMAQ